MRKKIRINSQKKVLIQNNPMQGTSFRLLRRQLRREETQIKTKTEKKKKSKLTRWKKTFQKTTWEQATFGIRRNAM